MTAKVTDVFGDRRAGIGAPLACRVSMVCACTCLLMRMCVFACVSDPAIVWKEEQWHSCARSSRWRVETQSQSKPRWHTEPRDRRMLLPPSGDVGQNGAVFSGGARDNKCTTASVYDKHIHAQIPMQTYKVDIEDFHRRTCHVELQRLTNGCKTLRNQKTSCLLFVLLTMFCTH